MLGWRWDMPLIWGTIKTLVKELGLGSRWLNVSRQLPSATYQKSSLQELQPPQRCRASLFFRRKILKKYLAYCEYIDDFNFFIGLEAAVAQEIERVVCKPQAQLFDPQLLLFTCQNILAQYNEPNLLLVCNLWFTLDKHVCQMSIRRKCTFKLYTVYIHCILKQQNKCLVVLYKHLHYGVTIRVSLPILR